MYITRAEAVLYTIYYSIALTQITFAYICVNKRWSLCVRCLVWEYFVKYPLAFTFECSLNIKIVIFLSYVLDIKSAASLTFTEKKFDIVNRIFFQLRPSFLRQLTANGLPLFLKVIIKQCSGTVSTNPYFCKPNLFQFRFVHCAGR